MKISRRERKDQNSKREFLKCQIDKHEREREREREREKERVCVSQIKRT